MKYILEIIPGTADFVLQEIQQKFENSISILKVEKAKIEFESEIEMIEDFYPIKSALRISKSAGLTINLFRRKWKVETAPAGVNPALAYIMCIIADVKKEDIVLDPFCGAGTIPISAAKYFFAQKVIASDLSGKAIDQTQANALAAKLHKKNFTAIRAGVGNLRLNKNSVNKIITNMPFGIRVGDHDKNLKIYKQFFATAKRVLKAEGSITALTQEKELFRAECKAAGMKIQKEIVVEAGRLYPTIFKVV